jgi:nicotinamidase-related amidase
MTRTPRAHLEPGQDGNALKPELTGQPDLLVTEGTNSAFYGEPDLHALLQDRGMTGFAVCGIHFDRLDPSGDLMTADEPPRRIRRRGEHGPT